VWACPTLSALSAIGYRLSAIGYRLSAIDVWAYRRIRLRRAGSHGSIIGRGFVGHVVGRVGVWACG